MTDENWVTIKQLMAMFKYASRDGATSFAERHRVSKKKIKGTNYFNLDEFEQAKKEVICTFYFFLLILSMKLLQSYRWA